MSDKGEDVVVTSVPVVATPAAVPVRAPFDEDGVGGGAAEGLEFAPPRMACLKCGNVRQFGGYEALVCEDCGGRVLQFLRPTGGGQARILRAI